MRANSVTYSSRGGKRGWGFSHWGNFQNSEIYWEKKRAKRWGGKGPPFFVGPHGAEGGLKEEIEKKSAQIGCQKRVGGPPEGENPLHKKILGGGKGGPRDKKNRETGRKHKERGRPPQRV